MSGESGPEKDQDSGRMLLVLALIALLLAGISCNLPVESSADGGNLPEPTSGDLIDEAIEMTLTAVVQASANQDAGIDQPENEQQQTAVESVLPPSATPSQSLSPTVTLTATPEIPRVMISENTNCRTGPGSVYDLLHIYLAGDQALLKGKNLEEDFWYIENPDVGIESCWLWGRYATPEGRTTDLPIFTPPPTPTPQLSFNVSYHEEACGYLGFVFKLVNTGEISLQSYHASLKDTVTNEKVSESENKFFGDTLIAAGKTGQIEVGYFSASAQGHKVKATVKICSDDQLKGYCTTRVITFKP